MIAKQNGNGGTSRSKPEDEPLSSNDWRLFSIGRLLSNALQRFEERMFELLEQDGHAQVRRSHLALTRNLDVGGTRAGELARRAGISKQAMAELIGQCEDLGLVSRIPDPQDARAKIVRFSPDGLKWFAAFRAVSEQAEREMRAELGPLQVHGIKSALEAYAGHLDPLLHHGRNTTKPLAVLADS